MSDAEHTRMRSHVLAGVRRIYASRSGERLSFSTLSIETQVPRRVLKANWGTIENLLADVVAQLAEPEALPTDTSSITKLREYLVMVRDMLMNPAVSAAVLALVTESKQADYTDAHSESIGEQWIRQFSDMVVPASREDYAHIVGPLVYTHLTQPEPASDGFIEDLVSAGSVRLGFR